jgi:hypothetical protein
MKGQSGVHNTASNLLRFPRLNPPFYRDEDLFVSLRDRLVILDGETVGLTPVQYRLLALLVTHAGEVVPRPILLMLTSTVDMHLSRLRKKLGIILRPAHRNRYRRWIPFPATAGALGLEELLHRPSAGDRKEISPALRLAVGPVFDFHPSRRLPLVAAIREFRHDSFHVPAAGCPEQIHATTFDVVHVKDWSADEPLEPLLPFD